MSANSGILYTVATPIGNLDDITKRAIDTLSIVDYVLCEDTRQSSKLLAKIEIKNQLKSYHKFNEKEMSGKVVEDLKSGINIALVSDAGTPCVSDPGRILVETTMLAGLRVVPISGASAVSTLLSCVPKNSEEYIFVGFLPRTVKEQKEILLKYKEIDLIIYESPLRVLKTLKNIKSALGNNTKIAVGRELTKLHEEVIVDEVDNLISHFEIKPPKGEFTLMIYGQKIKTTNSAKDFEDMVSKLKSKKYSAKDISIILSTLFDTNKNEIYKLLTNKN